MPKGEGKLFCVSVDMRCDLILPAQYPNVIAGNSLSRQRPGGPPLSPLW